MFRPKAQALSLFDRDIVRRAIADSFRKLAPRHVAKNPVMFVVEIGSVLTTLIFVRDLVHRASASSPLWFTGLVTLWLWFTVIFANFAEAVAEGPRQGAGRHPAPHAQGDHRAAARRTGKEEAVAVLVAAQGRPGRRRGRAS